MAQQTCLGLIEARDLRCFSFLAVNFALGDINVCACYYHCYISILERKISTRCINKRVLLGQKLHSIMPSRQVLFLTHSHCDFAIDIFPWPMSGWSLSLLAAPCHTCQVERRQAAKSPCGTGPFLGRGVSTLMILGDDTIAAAHHTYMTFPTLGRMACC